MTDPRELEPDPPDHDQPSDDDVWAEASWDQLMTWDWVTSSDEALS
jgi:hypothetical protein